MNSPSLLLLLLFSSLLVVGSSQTPPPPPPPPPQQQELVSFRPSVAIVIGIFSIMFSLTFLLLMYAKFCHSPYRFSDAENQVPPDAALLPNPRFSGLDRSLVESLPFFRFSALKGCRHGLDCAVCLSAFEDSDVLRLLPRCNHAFHLHCVDRWLDSHSSCPLCRARVQPNDLTAFCYSTSSRSLFRHDPHPDADLDLYVEREPDRSSRRKPDSGFHRTKHRVVVSDVVFKNRWSDLTSADLMSLNSEMLRFAYSGRFDPSTGDGALTINEAVDGKTPLEPKALEMSRLVTGSSSSLPPPPQQQQSDSGVSRVGGKRCASEISGVPRRVHWPGGDEKVERLWLPIARRTIQWLHGRERRSTQGL